MAIVHEPWLPISGALTDTASGSANIYGAALGYGALGDGSGKKTTPNWPGAPVSNFWAGEDANLVGHFLTDLNDLGTVPLFAASTATNLKLTNLSSSLDASSSQWNAASGVFHQTTVAYIGTSASVGSWTDTANYPYGTGSPYWPPELTKDTPPDGTGTNPGGFGYNLSGALVYTLYKAGSAQRTAVSMTNNTLALQNSATQYSQSLYGLNYTGSALIFGWGSGVIHEVELLSSSYFGANLPNYLALSGAVVQVIKTFLGTDNQALVNNPSGSWTGSYTTASFSNLRPAFYDMSGAFAILSNSYYPLSAAFSGDLVMTTALSAAFNLSASKWNDVSSSYTALSGNLNSSASIWNTNTTGALSTSFYALSGNLNSSASIWNANTTGALSSSVASLSNSYAAVTNSYASLSNSYAQVTNSFAALSNTLNSSASVWNGKGNAFLTSSNWNPAGGAFQITGSLLLSGTDRQIQITSGSIIATGVLAISASALVYQDENTNTLFRIDNNHPLARFYDYTDYGGGNPVNIVAVYGGLSGSSTPGIAGDGGRISFRSNDGTGVARSFASVDGHVADPAAGTYTGRLSLHIASNAVGADDDANSPALNVLADGFEFRPVNTTTAVKMQAVGAGNVDAYISSPTGKITLRSVVGTTAVSGALEITGTSATTLYLHSPNGNRWAITVGNDGVLSSTLA